MGVFLLRGRMNTWLFLFKKIDGLRTSGRFKRAGGVWF